jgi:hypothetical protein
LPGVSPLITLMNAFSTYTARKFRIRLKTIVSTTLARVSRHVATASRMLECGETGPKNSFMCAERLCPLCRGRPERNTRHHQTAANLIIQQLPAGSSGMLTLTVPDVPVSDIRAALRNMQSGVRRLWRHTCLKRDRVAGAKAFEVKRSPSGLLNAHCHLWLAFQRPVQLDTDEIAHQWQIAHRDPIRSVEWTPATWDPPGLFRYLRKGPISWGDTYALAEDAGAVIGLADGLKNLNLFQPLQGLRVST